MRPIGDPSPGPAQRRALGRTARQVLPRRSLAMWDPDARGHDALGTILGQNDARQRDLVAIRMWRMAASPWTYYRGAAAVMAADLASTPDTGIAVQLCGDAHVLNYGLWATPERQLSFDLRDFDETVRGPFEWDVKRYLASLVVLARDNGLADKVARRAVAVAVKAYAERVAAYAEADELTVWYDIITSEELLDLFEPEHREAVARRLSKQARRRTSAGAARKLTETVDGHLRIVEDPPTRIRLENLLPGEELSDRVSAVLQRYHDSLPYERRFLLDRFTLVDVARQVVGVGSVGMQVFLVLCEGRNGTDPLFLQVKEAGPSVYEQYLGPSPYPSHGQRVISGKRLIQAASDIFLGWTSFEGADFYVRQFRDMKVIPDSRAIAPYLVPFAQQCGYVLARAHARTGDALSISAYVGAGGRFAEAMTDFAFAYADQTVWDHRQLTDAIASGRVAVEEG